MPNEIECSGFPPAFPALTGSIPLAATHLDITRAMLAVGYPSCRSAIARVGRWRAILLRSMVLGYLTRTLCTTRYFANLEQSEKAAMSFLLAQALTYWFAQTHMGIPYIVHVRGARQKFTPAGHRTAPKSGSGPFKPRARPDFIGRTAGQYHVFESKGRSSALSASSLSAALAQVSMITAVNGSPPATRVAACFSFRNSGVTGNVRDPEGDIEGYNLSFDDVAAARKAYSFFLNPDVRESLQELVSIGTQN